MSSLDRVFHHQRMFSDGRLITASSFDICQLHEDFCLVSSAFGNAKATVSTQDGGKDVHSLHIELDKREREETPEQSGR